MKEDDYVAIIFIFLIGILAMALVPNYAPEVPITGAVIMAPAKQSTSLTNIFIIIGAIAAVIVIVVVLLYLKKRQGFHTLMAKFRPEMPKLGSELTALPGERLRKPEIVRAPRSENEALDHYVKAALASGRSKSQIRRTLLGVGWPNETIEKVLRQI